MVEARETAVRLARLRLELQTELEAVDRIAAELVGVEDELTRAPMSRPHLALAAVDLHGYYTACETLFERIARDIDRSVPSGSEWHSELLDQMAVAIPKVREALFDREVWLWLHELRRFRDFFRHAHAVQLRARDLCDLIRELSAHHASFRAHLQQFVSNLESAIHKAAGSDASD